MKRLMVLAVLMSLAAVGCSPAPHHATSPSTSGAASPALAVLVGLRQKTSAAGSAKVAFNTAMRVDGFPGQPSTTITMTGSGAFDYRAKRGTMQLELSGLGSDRGGSLPAGLTNPQMVVDGDTLYLHLPASLTRNGKSWAKMTPASMFGPPASGGSAGPASLFDGGGMIGFGDPSNSLNLLGGLGVSATVVGRETVRGVETTHYRTTIDPSKAVGDPAVTPTPDLSGLSLTPPSMPADVWVDAQGRLAKLDVTYDFAKALAGMMAGFAAGLSGVTQAVVPTALPSGLSGLSMIMSSTYESYDFGTPVNVTVPPASQVVDAAGLPGLGFANSGS